MKVGLQTWGTNGDMMPFLALAIGLRDAGHQIMLAYTSMDGTDLAERTDVEGIELLAAKGEAQVQGAPYSIQAKPGSFREITTLLRDYYDPHTEDMYQASEQLCRSCDVVVGHQVCHTLATAAELLGVQRITLALVRSSIRDKRNSPLGSDLGSFLNTALWSVGDRVATRSWFAPARRLREKAGLPPIRSLQRELFAPKPLTLLGVSGSLIPDREHLPEHVRVTGFLNMPIGEADALPPDLEAFLQGGPPPVYMTFGSCMAFDQGASTRLLLEAARLSGQRAIVQTAEGTIDTEVPKEVFIAGSLPHRAVFPRCSAVVHHGGAGTTQATLVAGVPSVVVAHGFDQPYWGQVLQHAGAAGEVLFRSRVKAEELAKAVNEVVTDNGMAQAAQRISEEMQQENGVRRSIELLTNLTSKNS